MAHPYCRYPDVRGDSLVFVADDDLWLAPITGGRASRITADHAPVAFPVLSPDGRQVAWSSTCDGTWEVYLLDLATGARRRLTYWADRTTRTIGWLGERVLIRSAHDQMDTGRTRVRAISVDGRVETIPAGLAMAYAEHGSGARAIATPNHRDPSMWKRYRGGTASRIWIDSGSGDWQRILPEVSAGLHGVGFVGDRLIFSSDLAADLESNPDGQAQLYSVDLAGGDLRCHTEHGTPEGYVRDPRTDGRRIVFHAHGRIHLADGLDSPARPVELELPGAGPRPIRVSGTDRLERIVPDRPGTGSVLEWRGAIWYLTHRGGPARALADTPGVRHREPALLGAESAVWASDALGEDCLEVAALTGAGGVRRLAAGELGRVLHLAGSHDGRLIAAISHDGAISLIDAETGTVRGIDRSTGGEATSISFSPDDRYLVWRQARGAEGERGSIRAAETASGEAFDLTSGAFDDREPVFSTDGKHLIFLSRRTFDPSYDELGFDLVFTDTTRPMLVPLRADQPAPFGVSADGWPLAEKTETEKAGSDAVPPVPECRIDRDGFEARAVAFNVAAGDYSGLVATADGVAWIRGNRTGHVLGTGRGPDHAKDRVEHYSFGKRKLETVAEPVDSLAVSGDGTLAVLRHEDTVWVQPSERRVEESDDARVSIDLARLTREIDPRAEWRNMFDDNGRIMREHYWRADLDGVDWDGVLARYRSLIERLCSHDDLVDLLWETVAELNTSHAYVRPVAGDPPGQGLLGAEFADAGSADTGQGAEIVAILAGESSDPQARSPLTAAGVNARVGEVITAINGRPVTGAADIGPLLGGTADQAVEVTIAGDSGVRRVAVVPVGSESALRYHQWVADRADYVDRKSEGRLGYLHVPDMMSLGWAQIHRLLERASHREGVVVDVRYNHGGHTSQLVIERLARKVIHWDLARHMDQPISYPHQAIRGPVVLVTNQWAGSDGDIVSASTQAIGLGPVVGERSWGGVIGIDGRFDLVDGTTVTQPRYCFWSTKHGWGIENHGIDPDIEVVMSPADFEAEAQCDPQLDTAIAVALQTLAEHPAAQPPELPPARVRRRAD